MIVCTADATIVGAGSSVAVFLVAHAMLIKVMTMSKRNGLMFLEEASTGGAVLVTKRSKWLGVILYLMVTKWSHVLSVVLCRLVYLASNRLTDNIKQHGVTGINIYA